MFYIAGIKTAVISYKFPSFFFTANLYVLINADGIL